MAAAYVQDHDKLAIRVRAGDGVEASEKRGLPVIHVADDYDVEMLTGARGAGYERRHSMLYMYPSLRNNSIPRPSSCARPERSTTVVLRSSSRIASTVLAVDLFGKVQGAQARLR